MIGQTRRCLIHSLSKRRHLSATFLGQWIAICILFAFGCNPPANDAKRSDLPRDPKASSANKTSDPSTANAASHIALESMNVDFGDFKFYSGQDVGLLSFVETIGGGVAVMDFDRDGQLDVLYSGGGVPQPEKRVWIGRQGLLLKGTPGGGFERVGEVPGLDFTRSYSAAVVASDYDADGWMDVLITGYGGIQLYRNQGDGTFQDVTEASGIEENSWSSTAAFLDADSDGDMDLYVAHYANWSFENNPTCTSHYDVTKQDYCGPRDFAGLPDSFYENLGDGTFRDVTEKVGLSDQLRGLGVMAADLDDDGDVDLYVANDVDPNLLYRNEGNWKFQEMGVRSGVAYDDQGRPEGSMGIALGDYNSDGRLDLWVSNYQNELCALYRNDGHMSFSYASRSARISATDEQSVSWGTAFNDLDLDGDEDLIVANGHIERFSSGSTYLQRPQALENLEGKFFRLVRGPEGKFLDKPLAARGLALGDFDHDGRMDFAISTTNEPPVIVRNQSAVQGKFLSVRLIGTKSNRDAVGAKISLQVGDRTWVRQVFGGGSYASTSDLAQHFGIPKAIAGDQKAKLTVKWPSGHTQTLETALNDSVLIVEGQ